MHVLEVMFRVMGNDDVGDGIELLIHDDMLVVQKVCATLVPYAPAVACCSTNDERVAPYID